VSIDKDMQKFFRVEAQNKKKKLKGLYFKNQIFKKA